VISTEELHDVGSRVWADSWECDEHGEQFIVWSRWILELGLIDASSRRRCCKQLCDLDDACVAISHAAASSEHGGPCACKLLRGRKPSDDRSARNSDCNPRSKTIAQLLVHRNRALPLHIATCDGLDDVFKQRWASQQSALPAGEKSLVFRVERRDRLLVLIEPKHACKLQTDLLLLRARNVGIALDA
jgi:hypothetical protein